MTSIENPITPNDKVKGGDYSLPLSVIHIISETAKSSTTEINTRITTTKFKSFPFLAGTVDSSPERTEVKREFICPECSGRFVVGTYQQAFVILTPEDFSSPALRYAFLKRRLIIKGLIWAWALLLISFLAFGCISTWSGRGDEPVVNGIAYILGPWLVAEAVAIVALWSSLRMGPTKRALFKIKGARSVAWRVVDHSRFFSLITHVSFLPVRGSAARHGIKLAVQGDRDCKCPEGGSFSLNYDSELRLQYKFPDDLPIYNL